MASTVVLTVKLEDSQAVAQQLWQVAGKPKEQAKALSQLFTELNSGRRSGAVDVQTGDAAPVAASGTITLTYANVTANDTVTICNTVITAKASGAVAGTEFNKETDATVTAANLATAINANTVLSKQVVATAASGVVTVTVRQKGVVGNGLALSTSDATAFALVAFAGGTGGANDSAVSNSLGV
jgi:phage tail sheath gpL-like